MDSINLDREEPSASMAPQVTAAFFALLLGFMLLIPFIHVSFQGATQPRLLLHVIRTDLGFNPFALLLLLTPLAGIIVCMAMRGVWALAATAIAIFGVIMVLLTIFTAQVHDVGVPHIRGHVGPGIGTFLFPVMLGILAVTSALHFLRARRDRT